MKQSGAWTDWPGKPGPRIVAAVKPSTTVEVRPAGEIDIICQCGFEIRFMPELPLKVCPICERKIRYEK